MKRLLVTSLLCVLTAPAAAAGGHDWYVVKTADGVYAYDALGVDVSPKTGFKTLSIVTNTSDGDSEDIFTIDCRRKQGMFDGAIGATSSGDRETLTMVEGSPDETPPDAHGWQPVREGGALKMAADAACKPIAVNAIRVESAQAARDQLKTLSN